MKIEKNSALLVIDIQQEDFKQMREDNMHDPQWDCIRNAKRVLDVFRAKKLPVIQIREVHRPDMVDFGRELDGSGDSLYGGFSRFRLRAIDLSHQGRIFDFQKEIQRFFWNRFGNSVERAAC